MKQKQEESMMNDKVDHRRGSEREGNEVVTNELVNKIKEIVRTVSVSSH